MAPPTQWTWVWASSGSRWWTGKPGVLQSVGSQRVGHNWVAELNHLRKNLSLTTKLPWSLKTGVKEKEASHTGRCWFFTWAPWSWKRVNIRNVCIPSSPEKDPPSPDDWDMTQGCFPQHPHLFTYDKLSVSHSVMPDSLRPHGLQPTRLLSVRFSRQGFWSGLPFPSPGDLPNTGIKPGSPALQADSLLTELEGRPHDKLHVVKKKRKKEKFFLMPSGCLQVYSHSTLPVSIVPFPTLEIVLSNKVQLG